MSTKNEFISKEVNNGNRRTERRWAGLSGMPIRFYKLNLIDYSMRNIRFYKLNFKKGLDKGITNVEKD